MSESNFSSSSVASCDTVAQRDVPRELLPHEIKLIQHNPCVLPTQIPNVFLPFNAVEDGDLLVGGYGESKKLSSIIRSHYVTPVADRLLPKNDHTYVIGLSYDQQTDADTQRSITGTVEYIRDRYGDWVLETPKEAAIRELQEEVGVTCDFKALNRPHTEFLGGAEWYTYAIHARMLRPTRSGEHYFLDKKRPYAPAKYKGQEKVQVHVYGSLDELLGLLKHVSSRICAERDICGVRLLRSTDIHKAFNLPQPSSMRKW